MIKPVPLPGTGLMFWPGFEHVPERIAFQDEMRFHFVVPRASPEAP